MLFAKLFGGRRQAEPDDPPSSPPGQARVPPPRPKAVAPHAVPAPSTKPAGPDLQVQESPAGSAPAKDPSKGFDPYNSGVFNKSRAWERINRR